jgi:hypothetical protein
MDKKITIVASSNKMQVTKSVWASQAEQELKQIKKDHDYFVNRYGILKVGTLKVFINGIETVSR